MDELSSYDDDPRMDYITFRSMFERHPEQMFNDLQRHLDKLENKTGKAPIRSDVEQELAEAQDEIADLKGRMRKLRADALAIEHERDDLIQERDEARGAAEDLERQLREESSTPAPGGGKKSSKLPDGKPLTDGKDPSFESWLIDVENKLEANADHYPTALARMQYVKSMCQGDAGDHLIPRFRKDSPQRYRDVDDMIEHLKTIYSDANRVTTAKRQFRQLFMNDMKFQDFLSKFALYAQNRELPMSQWKDELYEKLSPEMQKALVKESYDDTMDYQTFVRECHQTANRFEMIAENEKRSRPRGNRTNHTGRAGAGTGRDDKRDGADGDKPKDNAAKGKGRSRLPWAVRQQLIAEGKCFVCKKPGHLASECEAQEKESTPDLKALEAAKQGSKEEDESTDSGNESA
jgi:hypothetical protein